MACRSSWIHEEFPALIIVANKVDLRGYYPDEDIVSHEEGEKFTKMISEKLDTLSIFIETSALTGENVDEAFNRLTSMMINPDEFETVESKQEEPVHETEPTPAAGFSSSTPSVTSIAEASAENTSSMTTQEAQIGYDMTELIELRTRLKEAEQDLREFSLEIETKLLNLKNTVHVKKIMYEHLRQQLAQTRQEWADAYDEHVELDKQKKNELEKKFAEIKNIRIKIDEIESTMKKEVQNLNFE